jgi:hypothetical protein
MGPCSARILEGLPQKDLLFCAPHGSCGGPPSKDQKGVIFYRSLRIGTGGPRETEEGRLEGTLNLN